jgi:hypothetical protein
MPLPKWVLANLRGTEPERVRYLQNYKHTHRWKLVKKLRQYSFRRISGKVRCKENLDQYI